MLLRGATDDELPKVVDLVNRAFRGSEGWAVEGRVMDGPRILLENLRADISAKPDALQLVWRGEANGTLVGSVWMEPVTEEVWYLGLLCVNPQAQAKQLGRTLLEASEALAREHGARRMRITVMTIRDTGTSGVAT